MKQLLIIFCSLSLALGASAQRGHGGYGGHGGYIRPRVTVIAPVRPYVGLGLGYGYSPFGYPFGYAPFYNQPYERPSSKLDLQIEDIKNNYSYQVSSTRHDKSLSKDERKQKIRDLKHDRDEAIIDAKKDYYKSFNRKQDDAS